MRIDIRRSVAAFAFAAVAAIGTASCSLDMTNPNGASEDAVLDSPDALQALAVGLQRYWATSVMGSLIINEGITAREVAANANYIGEVLLDQGGPALDGSVGEVATIFGNLMNVMRMSDQVIERAPELPMEPGTRSGMLALAHLYRAMALGNLIQVFEQAPTEVDPSEAATFHSRAEVLSAALEHLDVAAGILAETPVSTTFETRVKSSGLDLPNTIRAMQARFQLMAGNYELAIAAANAVDPQATSFYAYDALNRNPVFSGLVQGFSYAARDNFGSPLTEPGDQRLDFFLEPSDLLSNPGKYPIDELTGFFSTGTSPIPVYRPGELNLIRAEAQLRLGNLAAAVQEIDAVRTKTAATDPLGLGAGLPPYSGPVTPEALATEIYRQRAAELFLSATRLEDSRRLGRPGPPTSLEERNRNYYPYPDQERNNNPNTPPNPAT